MTDTDQRTFGQLLLDLDIHLSPEAVDRLEGKFRVYLACRGYPLTTVPYCSVERHTDSNGRLIAETVKPSSLEMSASFERACQCAQMSLSHLSAMTERFLADLHELATGHGYPRRLGTDLARGILANYWQDWSQERFYQWAMWLVENYTNESTEEIRELSELYETALEIYDQLFRDYCGFSPRLGAK
ncbi:DUF3375 domain-containing protein [Thermosynechococcus sp. HN-54]|uniref:DUF3375 domain-containing protein n=1 Tax=Thermosynechococcus sp. HN-54 TaxID=2933959 RepID=UPI00202D08FD|nr:DUF3375 domain-containing protein [Thermosynechococcus sp. HN-54]URR35676.1 DUF3375 domain-containing protein [Thermosynechococcus sp. HN-54]